MGRFHKKPKKEIKIFFELFDMKPKYKDEYVLVFHTSLLRNIGPFQGLNFDLARYLEEIKSECRFLRRADVEKDTTYKQLIPYVILHHKKSIFSYRRGALLSEKRLLNDYSIGIGGHISANDPNLFTSSYEEGMRREVQEEIYIESNYEPKAVALINDDSNEVGKVHFGIIHVFNLAEPRVRKKEKSINEPQFITLENLKKNIDRYENWSHICIKNIDKLIDS